MWWDYKKNKNTFSPGAVCEIGLQPALIRNVAKTEAAVGSSSRNYLYGKKESNEERDEKDHLALTHSLLPTITSLRSKVKVSS